MKNRFIETFELHPDAARALRGMAAFAVPVFLCHWLGRPVDALFISTASLNLALPDLRGGYRIRLSILATMTAVAAGSAMLGVWNSENTMAAVVAMGFIALFGGFWWHLSTDYGPGVAVNSALLFLLGLSQPGGWQNALHLAWLVSLGGAIAGVFHVWSWIIRPQHALRSAVAETWVAAADLAEGMRVITETAQPSSSKRMAELESELRAALDRTFGILGAAEGRQRSALITHLEEMRREVVHFTMGLIAVHTFLEPLRSRREFLRVLPAADSVLKALSDAARSVGITLILHRSDNFAASNARLKRVDHLISALSGQILAVRPGDLDVIQAKNALEKLQSVLPKIQARLRETSDHTQPGLMLSARLPEFSRTSIKSLGAWLTVDTHPDPVLLRHSVRIAVFSMLAVGLAKGFDIPRGYWMAFAIMVVLQPDYGSTRHKAGQRIVGTIAASLLAAVFLRIKLSLFFLDALATGMAFAFAYFLRRRYDLAIFFVTVMLVLMTETMAPLRREFMINRVLCTIGGCGLALFAARVFWPVWEGEKFPALLAAAIRANRSFLEALAPRLGMLEMSSTEPLKAKRGAENANRYVAASLERLLGEPESIRDNAEQANSLATYNQRITRALTALMVQLPESDKKQDPFISSVVKQIGELLDQVAGAVELGCADTLLLELNAEIDKLETGFRAGSPVPKPNESNRRSPAPLTVVQLAKIITEIRIMILAMKSETSGATAGLLGTGAVAAAT